MTATIWGYQAPETFTTGDLAYMGANRRNTRPEPATALGGMLGAMLAATGEGEAQVAYVPVDTGEPTEAEIEAHNAFLASRNA